MKKRTLILPVILTLLLPLTACFASHNEFPEALASSDDNDAHNAENVYISLWTYPIGSWANPSSVAGLISSFHKAYPNIHVSVEYLDYSTGDEKINAALENGKGPDIVFEGPERLVAQWGNQGLMADLTDLWSTEKSKEIYPSVQYACHHPNGEYYIFPICMTTHCMAVNYDLFKAADALQYIDEKNRTWSTEDFIHAVNALTAYGQERVGAVYCKNQGGDQGTRALVTNLYGGSFTDAQHSTYCFDSEENIKALQLLYDLEGITFSPNLVGSDEIDLFCSGELAMAFCWNVTMEINQTVNNPDLSFDILPMAFPTSSGSPKLQGGIWGFGIFDYGDKQKIEAAKTLISFMTDNDAQYTKAVSTSGLWPVRDLDNLYANDQLMTEYRIFTQYMGDYYQITPGWSEARSAWWQMLQSINNGEDIPGAVRKFNTIANDAAAR